MYRRKKDKRKKDEKENAPDGVRTRLLRLPLLKYELKSQLDLHVHNSNTMKNNSDSCNYNSSITITSDFQVSLFYPIASVAPGPRTTSNQSPDSTPKNEIHINLLF